MKYIFIINPTAGKNATYDRLIGTINEAFKGNTAAIEIYITQFAGDAIEYIKEYDNKAFDELCFVACGGDGTVNEVINGIMLRQDNKALKLGTSETKGIVLGSTNLKSTNLKSINLERISFSIYPCGTGNDFIKNFDNPLAFKDIAALISGKKQEVDLYSCKLTTKVPRANIINPNNDNTNPSNDITSSRYGLNICNFGLDAKVAQNMTRFKRLPLVTGFMAYSMSIAYCLLQKIWQTYTYVLDGHTVQGGYILGVAANGISYGGGYYPTPKADVNDGLLDFIAVKKMSRLKISQFLKIFQKGMHLENSEMKEYFIFRKAKNLEVKSDSQFTVSIDGEIYIVNELEVRVIKSAIEMIVPEARALKATGINFQVVAKDLINKDLCNKELLSEDMLNKALFTKHVLHQELTEKIEENEMEKSDN